MAERHGATLDRPRVGTFGSCCWVMLRGRRAILPMDSSRKELKTGTVAAIKKQLKLE
jgi:hypothetical protein